MQYNKTKRNRRLSYRVCLWSSKNDVAAEIDQSKLIISDITNLSLDFMQLVPRIENRL